MGKLVVFITILIFIDLMFVATGQTQMTTASMVFDVVENPTLLRSGTFWLNMVGQGDETDQTGSSGLIKLLTVFGVTAGFIVTRSNLLLYIPIALALGLLASDFITIFNVLRTHNPVLAIFFMIPIMVLFALIITEWARGTD